jgi:serine/threonine protein kinase
MGFQEIRQIFSTVSAAPPGERERLLDSLCPPGTDLRGEVEELLACDANASSALEPPETPALILMDDVLEQLTLNTGDSIGPYVIQRLLAQGGMGAVYLAEQHEPIQRTVALKVIKIGMDTRGVIERFERERQALALMNHPNIANVYEAGATPAGRPYFAMEYVDGTSITEYCDTQDLNLDERIRLYIKVCQAIQHAHQKGIIHRDLKPANVLVSKVDGESQPKVIDFGIAKATTESDDNLTHVTSAGQLIGTPEYMAPEQRAGATSGIDTRCDVYALGVMLYELITGKLLITKTPDIGTLIKPSNACEKLPRRQIRAELDWIVLRALETAPDDRYSTADQLARDLQAYLADKPVSASPPSRSLACARFVRRNKKGVFAGTLITSSLLLGLVTTSIGFSRARTEQITAQIDSETSSLVSSFLTNLLASANPDQLGRTDVTVSELLSDASQRLDRGELSDRPSIQARLRIVLGRSYQGLADYELAAQEFEHALEILYAKTETNPLDIAVALDELANSYTHLARYDEAESNYQKAIAIRETLGHSTPLVSQSNGNLGIVYHWTGRFEEGVQYFSDSLDQLKRAPTPNNEAIASALGWLGMEFGVLGRTDDSIKAHLAGIDVAIDVYGEMHTVVAAAYNNIANTYESAERYNDALDAHELSLSIKRAMLPHDHPDIAISLNNMGLILIRQEKPGLAESYLREAIALHAIGLGDSHPSTAVAHANLGQSLLEQGRPAEAIPMFERAIEIALIQLDDNHLMPTAFRINYARCHMALGQFEHAESMLLAGHARLLELLPPDHRRVQTCKEHLANLYIEWGRAEEAAYWLR